MGQYRLVVALLGIGGLLVLAGCAVPGTGSVCMVCTDGEVDVDRGGTTPIGWGRIDNVSLDESEVHLRYRRDGTIRWVERVELHGDGVERLRNSANLTEFVVDNFDPGAPAEDVRNLEARFSGDVLVVTYETDDQLRRTDSGVAVDETFFSTNDPTTSLPAYHLYADRVVVHAPEGMVVSNRPRGTIRVNESAVAWTRGQKHERGTVPNHVYVAFDEDDGVGTWVRTQYAVAEVVAGWAVDPLLVSTLLLELHVLAVVGVAVLVGRDSPVAIGEEAQPDWVDRRGHEPDTVNVSANLAAIRFPWELLLGFALCLPMVVAIAGSGWRGVAWLVFSVPIVPFAIVLVLGPVADLSPGIRRALVGVLLGTPLLATLPPTLDYGGGGSLLVVLWFPAVLLVGVALMGLGWAGTRILRDELGGD